MDPLHRGTLILSSVFCTVAGIAIGFVLGVNRGKDPFTTKVATTRDIIRDHYLEPVDPETLERKAVEGMVSGLEDPYSQYVPADEWARLQSDDIEGEFTGVGIRIERTPEGFLRVITPIEGSPAMAADILPGDIVLKVDGEDIRGWTLKEIINRIRGEEGTEVLLTIRRTGGETREVRVTRARIKVNPVFSRLIEGEPAVGYLRISDFTAALSRGGWFLHDARRLLDQGAKGLIVDLRFNPGGLLDEVVRLCDLFIANGVIVESRGRNEEGNQRFEASPGDPLESVPLVVLINEGSASASEIFAACVQDHGRGTLVGEPSYGKGTVQKFFGLPDGSRLRLTIARYYSPKGKFFDHQKGQVVRPDIEVKMTPEEYAEMRKAWIAEATVKGESPIQPGEGFVDKQLKKAVEILRSTVPHER